MPRRRFSALAAKTLPIIRQNSHQSVRHLFGRIHLIGGETSYVVPARTGMVMDATTDAYLSKTMQGRKLPKSRQESIGGIAQLPQGICWRRLHRENAISFLHLGWNLRN
jgi:hypothetical protein